MRIVTVKMPEEYLVVMDMLVSKGVFSSRSEFVREAVRRLIMLYRDELGREGPRKGVPELYGSEGIVVRRVRLG